MGLGPERLRLMARAGARRAVRPGVVRSVLRRMARARLLPHGVWRRLPSSPIVRFEVRGRVLECRLPDTDGVARELDWVGLAGDEAATIEVVAKLAAVDGATIDVGANVGLYSTIAAACSDDAVWAFEPVPRTFRILEENLARNQLSGRVQTARQAVGRDRGSATFHVPFGDCPSSASLTPGGYRGLDGVLIEVDVVRLDDVIDKSVPVSLVKIDVEGFEDAVLDGMERMISRWAPAIVLESNHDGPHLAVEECLRRHGYGFSQLRPGGPSPVTTLRTDEDERYRNFLCEPSVSSAEKVDRRL